MSINNFIPTIWSARMLNYLDKAHVFTNCVNRDYEGEIKAFGDTVKINAIGAITVGKYTKNTDIGDAETLADVQKELKIDQAKFFNFQVDDIDKAQQNPKVIDSAMSRASYAVAEVIDQFIAGFYTDAGNTIGTDAAPETVTATKAYEYIVKCGQKLDEANVPRDNRYIVVPPAFYSMLLLDSRFISAGTTKTDEVLATGLVGMVNGFNVYMSNNVNSTDGKFHIIAGHPYAISYAEQVVEVEAYRPEKRFADAVKGLTIYGGKVIDPTALVTLTATF